MIQVLDNLIMLLDAIGISVGALVAIVFTLAVYGLYRMIVKVVALCKRFRKTSRKTFVCLGIVCAFLVAVLASLLSRVFEIVTGRFGEMFKVVMFLLGSHVELPTSLRSCFSNGRFAFKRLKTELLRTVSSKTTAEKPKSNVRKISLKASFVPTCSFVMRN